MNGKQRVVAWKCRCDCGNVVTLPGLRIKYGNTKSCGCATKKFISDAKVEDLTGQRFGMLTVVERDQTNEHKRVHWICQCDCGNVKSISATNLKRGNSKSCGCVRIERIVNHNRTHGMSHTRLYSVWQGMRERCQNPNHISYEFYGARGIKVCDEWNESFESFMSWAEENGYDWFAARGECTLDRKDVDGNYSPDNCEWITMNDQNKNRRSDKEKRNNESA